MTNEAATRRTALAAMCAAAWLSACSGGGEGTAPPAPPAPPAPAPDPTLQPGTVLPFEVPAVSGHRALTLSDGRQLLMLHGLPDQGVWLGRYAPGSATPDVQHQLYAGSANCCTFPLPSGTRAGADASGGAVLAWLERSVQFPFQAVVVARLRADGSLGPRTRVATRPDHAVLAFDLAVRSDGTALLAWAEAGPVDAIVALGPTRILSAEFDTQDRLSAVQQVSGETLLDTQVGAMTLQAVSSDNGHRMVSWCFMSGRDGNDQLRASRAAPGGNWQAEVLLTPPIDLSRKPRVGQVEMHIDAQGDGLVVWQSEMDSGNVRLAQLRRLRGATGFGTVETLAEDVMQFRLARHGGRHAIAWRVGRPNPDTAALRLATFSSLDAVPQQEVVDLGGTGSIDRFDMGMLPDGHVLLVWASSPVTQPLRMRQRATDGRWLPMQTLAANATEQQADPQLSAAGVGQLLLSWQGGTAQTPGLRRVSLRR